MTPDQSRRLIAYAGCADRPILPRHPNLAAMAREAMARRDWAGFLVVFGSHQTLEPFLSIQRQLTDCEYWRTLAEVWIGAEWGVDAFPVWEWLFTKNRPASGSAAMMNEKELASWNSLPAQLTVY